MKFLSFFILMFSFQGFGRPFLECLPSSWGEVKLELLESHAPSAKFELSAANNYYIYAFAWDLGVKLGNAGQFSNRMVATLHHSRCTLRTLPKYGLASCQRPGGGGSIEIDFFDGDGNKQTYASKFSDMDVRHFIERSAEGDVNYIKVNLIVQNMQTNKWTDIDFILDGKTLDCIRIPGDTFVPPSP